MVKWAFEKDKKGMWHKINLPPGGQRGGNIGLG
jgi:hypothetical protein